MVGCRSLVDGRMRWEKALDEGGVGRLMLQGNGLWVWPAAAPEVRIGIRWLHLGLQWRGGPPALRQHPVAVLDPATGKQIQKLTFSVRRGVVEQIATTGRLTVLPRIDELSREVRDTSGLRVEADAGEMIVQLGPRIWGLRAEKK